MIHQAMNIAQGGDVLVIDSRGCAECSGSGAVSLTPPIQRGLAGVIFGKGLSPYSPPKSRPGEINVSVTCGGVYVDWRDGR